MQGKPSTYCTVVHYTSNPKIDFLEAQKDTENVFKFILGDCKTLLSEKCQYKE